MTRTTIALDPGVIRGLRERARRERKSMGQVASELLSRALDEGLAESPPFEWISHDLGEPLVDLEDSDALWAILDVRS